MKYNIHITDKAESDLIKAADYIEFTLLNPKAANDLLDKTEEEIGKLAFMPEKHQPVDDPILASWGIRLITVNNYLAFYLIDESSKTVHIVRFLYGKRNWVAILRSGLPNTD